jgi:transposase InsO family protein
MRKEQYHMTQKEIMKLKVINQTLDGTLTIKEAAAVLGLSERQVKRLKKGVLTQGPGFVIHKNRNRSPIHAIADSTRDVIIKLKQTKYSEANFSHFTELLAEFENVYVSRSTIHRLLNAAGIKSPKKHKRVRLHHHRKRKSKAGLLVQIDASPFPWLGGDELYNLHGAIDDATGQILGLFLAKNECLNGYFQVMHQVITGFGIPVQLYSDRHTIFFSPKKKTLSLEEQLTGKQIALTQFGQAMDELGIKMIPAGSPQAKGRIEKLWGTLQSRLPVELKLANACSLDDANAFLTAFLPKFNSRFAVQPACPESAFAAFDDRLNLDFILCVKEQRKLDGNQTFSFMGQCYQINTTQSAPPPRAKITVLYSPKFGVMAAYQGHVYTTLSVLKPPAVKAEPAQPRLSNASIPRKPSADHPWKKAQHSYFYDQSDREILEALFNSTLALR